MKELSKEKQLKFMGDVERHIEEIVKDGHKGKIYEEAKEIIQQIRKLIENKPKVEIFHSPIVSFGKTKIKPKIDKMFINEKAKWIYENSMCLDSAVHKTRHPITVEASMRFVKQMLTEADVEVEEGKN